jgi:folate-binding protein YgfZ
MSATASMESSDALDWSRIRVLGEESESFLQGQLTQDLSIVDEQGRWSFLLRPDSAVLTTGFVQRVPEGFDLLVPREVSHVALSRLRRFHLRVKCTLELDDALSGPISTVGELVRATWPGVNEFQAELTPQSYGARIVADTVSFTKGCYTGQELVARLDARAASVPWRFVHASGPSVSIVDEVLRSKGPAGPHGVTTAINEDGRVSCLGFAHRTLLDANYLATFPDVVVEPAG